MDDEVHPANPPPPPSEPAGSLEPSRCDLDVPVAIPPLLEPAASAAPVAPVRGVVFWYLGISVAVSLLAFVVPGELGSFLMSSWETTPLVLLCVMAYAGLDRPWARVATWVTFGLLCLLALGCVVMVTALTLMGVPGGPPALGSASKWPWLLAVGALGAATFSFAALPAWPAFRRLWPTGTDARSAPEVSTLALATVLPLTALFLVPLAVLGEPPFLAWLKQLEASGGSLDDARGPGGMLRDQVYSLCWILPATFFAVGYGVRRNGREVFARLGLVRPTRRQWAWVVILTAGLLTVVQGVDLAVSTCWHRWNWPTTDEDALEALFAFALSPVGAVVVGVTAGLGEELAIRGVLQPRLGILLSNLFFTALHGLQYHWDGLVSVFVVGLVLGLIRRRSNTTVAAAIHGGYDFVLIMTEVLARRV